MDGSSKEQKYQSMGCLNEHWGAKGVCLNMRKHRSKSLFSIFRSHIYAIRGARYAFRLLTGKRMGFSFSGPAGMRFHMNSDGSLRSFSLKAFAGIRVICGSNGKFKSLSIPGPFKTRLFVNSKSELTGFGIPRIFGGYLLYDAKGRLKRVYGPRIGGMCVSRDSEGNRKKHKLEGSSVGSLLNHEVKHELPGTHTTYTRKGEVTDRGIIPISDENIKSFNSIKDKGEYKTKRSYNHVRQKEPVHQLAYDGTISNNQAKMVSPEHSSPQNDIPNATPVKTLPKDKMVKPKIETNIKENTDGLDEYLAATFKKAYEVHPNQEEISFDDFFEKK